MALTIQAGNVQNSLYGKTDRQNANRKTIDARNLLMANTTENQVGQRRDMARKQAMKLIGNAWTKAQESASDRDSLDAQKEDKLAELSEYTAKLGDIEKSKKQLQEEYGVDPDSKEQKDLELLEKYQDNIMGASYDSFSDEEKERLKQLSSQPFTEYQKKALQLNNLKGQVAVEAGRKRDEIAAFQAEISDASLEQLKSQDMLKAQDAAGQILDASNWETLTMLVQDGKDNIDEKTKEEQEEQEKVKEEKEEKQEKIDEKKQKQKEQEEILRGEQQSDQMELDLSLKNQTNSPVNDAQKQIQKILKDNKLINEDLKGIEIDFNF